MEPAVRRHRFTVEEYARMGDAGIFCEDDRVEKPRVRSRPRRASGHIRMNDTLEGPPILSAIKASGVEVVVSVPDIVTSEGLLRPIAADPDLRHIRVCKEDEGVSICAALSYCGVRALLMMQQTGMYDSMNAIRAVAAGYGLPVCMLIGLQGAVAGEDPRRSEKHIVRCALPALDAIEVEHHVLRHAGDVRIVVPAIDGAYRGSRPVALFIGAMLPGA